jgi:hypothetical protein
MLIARLNLAPFYDVNITPGVGAAIGADSISGTNYERVKLIHGVSGVSAGDVAATNPLPVQHQLNPTDLSETALNVAASGDNSVVALSGGKIIRVWAFWLKVNGSGTGVSLKWRDGTTDLHPALPFNDKDGWVMGFGTRPWFTCTVSNALQLNLSASIQVSGRVYYTQS